MFLKRPSLEEIHGKKPFSWVSCKVEGGGACKEPVIMTHEDPNATGYVLLNSGWSAVSYAGPDWFRAKITLTERTHQQIYIFSSTQKSEFVKFPLWPAFIGHFYLKHFIVCLPIIHQHSDIHWQRGGTHADSHADSLTCGQV